MRYSYIPQGICPVEIFVTLDGDTVAEVDFIGGCDGNLKVLSRMARGMKTDSLIQLLSGITCDDKDTSCGDQLAKAISAAIKAQS
ncbi:MAG: TIGR03905 family TSCPD domain-containing protein [Clostridiales bacterium]|nr:TIGR03905 family TSCPD domain-containing protein [Clostridiales bacterium]